MSAKNKSNDALAIIADTMIQNRNVSSELFLKNAFEAIFKLIPEAEKGSLYVLEEGVFRPRNSNGYDLALLNKLHFTDANIFIGYEVKSIDQIDAYVTYVEERDASRFDAELLEVFKKLGTYANFVSLYAPIMYGPEIVGLISLESFTKKKFSKSAKDSLKIYAQVISNYYSISKQKEVEEALHEETINALISAIEIKDSYTEGHARRVMKLTEKISDRMTLSNEEKSRIKLAALFHDIGKIGIPTEILTKPGRLTQDEFETVKTHPEKATQILSKIKAYADILPIVLHHHERIDGKGYPLGISGSDIPIGSQIIMVADSYDAMTSQRAYRSSLSHEEALEELRRHSGTQFSSEIVEIALEVMKSSEPSVR